MSSIDLGIIVSIPELEKRWGSDRSEWGIPMKSFEDDSAPVQFQYSEEYEGYVLFAKQNDGLYYQVSNAVYDASLNFLRAV